MSYMDQTAFAPAAGIQELSFDEINLVDGGNRVADALGAAGAVAGTVSFVAGTAAFIPGPHTVGAGAVALAFGAAGASLTAASYMIKWVSKK